ncbi:MAG: glycosyltransferase family 2 protein, partial [Candidatus Omnitrophica bacterium]|nr:glycosyltransferase family 2 protein [Candidatus Omnitrophota bacterium]
MISVIVVNYNKKDMLKRCLDSVRGQGLQDIEIIVVDNASSDDSVEMVGRYYPDARLIWNTRNLFFCKAYNQGIDRAKGSFILCLNNDVVLDKDYLKEALAAIGVDIRVGMVSGKILRPDRKTIDSTGLFLGRNRKPVERGYGRKDRGQYERPGYVFGVSGACAFFRRGMLKDVKDANGYFDERFGMYYEDLDLCWRAQKKKWKAYYTPKAIAYHERAGTAVNNRCRRRAGLNLPYVS